MTIEIPKPVAIVLAALGALVTLGGLWLVVQELPDLTRYLKQVEGL